MNIVLLTTDLTVVSRVEGAAKLVGADVQIAPNAAQALMQCDDSSAKALVIDLSTPALDLGIIQQLAADPKRSIRIIAFGPHVHEDRLAAARAAGCDLVLSRGQFFRDISAIISKCVVETPHQ